MRAHSALYHNNAFSHTTLPLLVTLFLCFFVSACATQKAPSTSPAGTLVDKSLHEAAGKIRADLAILTGSAQQHDTASPRNHLSAPMSLRFEGPLTQALEKICASSGFRLSVVGKPKTPPTIVHIAAENTPVISILRDIGMQTKSSELLRIIEEANLIEIVFLAEDKQPQPPADLPRKS